MARESKVVVVTPQEEQRMIELFQCFGWEVIGTQEIFNRPKYVITSQMSQDDITQGVTAFNSVRLLLSREKTTPLRPNLIKAENAYWAVKVEKKRTNAFPLVLGLLLLVVAMVGLFFFQETFEPLYCFICGGVGLLLVLVQIIWGASVNSFNAKAVDVALEKRREIATRALGMVDGQFMTDSNGNPFPYGRADFNQDDDQQEEILLAKQAFDQQQEQSSADED